MPRESLLHRSSASTASVTASCFLIPLAAHGGTRTLLSLAVIWGCSKCCLLKLEHSSSLAPSPMGGRLLGFGEVAPLTPTIQTFERADYATSFPADLRTSIITWADGSSIDEVIVAVPNVHINSILQHLFVLYWILQRCKGICVSQTNTSRYNKNTI